MENSVWRSGSLALVGALALCGCGGAGSSTQASTGPVASPSPTPTPPTSDAATGIFVLDSPAGTFRDGNLRTQDFLAGYAWRYGWSLMEPAQDAYDFAALDHILARVAERHQKLSWIVMPTPGVSAEPAYVLAQAGTWTDAGGTVHALPWDSFTLARYQAFMTALAAHRVADPAQNGALVPLGDHSAFYAINVTFPGMPNLALRDSHDAIVDIPGYTRTALEDAVVASLRAVRTAFPKQRVHFGFWKYQNDGGSGEAWQSMQSRIDTEFGGTVGVFEDNLAASRPCPDCDPYSATPAVDFAAPLAAAKSTTYTAFQALTSWTNPGSVDPAKVMNGTPMDGIDYALQNFGSRYVELYVDDVDRPDWQAGLRAAAAKLAQDGDTSGLARHLSRDASFAELGETADAYRQLTFPLERL
ncbi:MAG TPA: hypothetical protein VFS13_20460 [Steroidobacteraceae bacterium]|nr:hypothetical protein [Steroidobacteraceae bacterium]